jgi:hypothetical protein
VKTFTSSAFHSLSMGQASRGPTGTPPTMAGMGKADGAGEPPAPGRARELVGRRRPRTAPDTGRVHHLGAAPAVMPVLPGDGTDDDPAASTRTAAVQLAARTRWELDRLATDLAEQMTAAASELDFERAGRVRDELARVRAELDRRSAR